MQVNKGESLQNIGRIRAPFKKKEEAPAARCACPATTSPPTPSHSQCTRLRALTSAADLWDALGSSRWPRTWRMALALAEEEWRAGQAEACVPSPSSLPAPLAAAARLARPTPRRAYAARAALPDALSDGAEALATIKERAEGLLAGAPSHAGPAAAVASLARAGAATTAALASAFEDTMRALFAAGLPVCADPALRRSVEYRCVAGVVGWWVSAAPAVVVGFARAASARLGGGGGGGGGGGAGRDGAGVGNAGAEAAVGGGGDPFAGAAPAALVAWPDTPWRASALALFRSAAAGLPGGGGPGAASVLDRLEAEADRLAAALERLAPDDDGVAAPGAWSSAAEEGEDGEGWSSSSSEEGEGRGAPWFAAATAPDDGTAHALLRSFGLSPSVFGAWERGGGESPAPVHPAAAGPGARPRARTRSRLGLGGVAPSLPPAAAPPRPCLAVPHGVPASHWWWHGRTPAEAARSRHQVGRQGVDVM